MKFAVVTLALVAAVAAQSIGPIDPAKLANGWCMTIKEMSCEETITSCTCTPKAGGELKDLSFEAFNETFTLMPYGICSNLQWTKNTTHPGIVSGDYKPDGKRPTLSTVVPKPTGSASAPASPSPTGDGKSAGSSIQIAISTMGLAAVSSGLAMI
ncbi:hypothetical protein BGZ81_002431 [Podila clonocystis]|nr:hypothetical protein BGZ81_002431 [Podila clonocystis]